jgi:hypothetical protein
MGYRLTLIEYDQDIYDGDNDLPSIEHRDYNQDALGGESAIAVGKQIEADRLDIKIETQISDLHNYFIGISSSSSSSSSSESSSSESSSSESSSSFSSSESSSSSSSSESSSSSSSSSSEPTGDWLGVSSSDIYDFCGEETGLTLAEALDGTDVWEHLVNETHYFVIDLGASYTVKMVRGRSYHLADPTDVNIYVSTDGSTWGTAVAAGITTWQDCSSGEWVEIDVTDKVGRYVKVEIVDTEDALNKIKFGSTGTPFSIFDVFGEAV